MIALLSIGLVIAVIVFFGLRFLRLGNALSFAVAGFVFIAIGGFAFYAFSRIDGPPPGSRTVTRDELLRSAAVNPSKEIAEPDGAANGSQPILSETNRTSAAAGSDR
jgi:hypothetical protein